MKPIKHSLRIQIKCLDGIQVWDNKRQEGSSLCKLNKVSAIVSVSRNRRTKSTGSSLPLQPAGTVETCQNVDQSFRYKAFWDCDLKEEHTIVFDTNLHRHGKKHDKNLSRNNMNFAQQEDTFESKTFQIVVGLKRADEFIVFAASALSIHGPVDSMDMNLPLRPVGVSSPSSYDLQFLGSSPKHQALKPVYFSQDPSRKFCLAMDACLKVTVSVHNQISWYQKQIQEMSGNAPPSTISNLRAKATLPMPTTSSGFRLQDRKVQSERVLANELMAPPHALPRAFSQSINYDPFQVDEREIERNGMNAQNSVPGIGHSMYEYRDGIQDRFTQMYPSESNNPSFHQPQLSVYMDQPGQHYNDVMLSPSNRQSSVSNVHRPRIELPPNTRNEQVRLQMKTNDRGASKKSIIRKQNPKNKKSNKRHVQRPKSALEAFGDLYNALGDVAKEMAKEDRDSSSSYSSSYSHSSRSYSYSDEDEDESFTDESSRPTIPGLVNTRDEGLPVHEDLTVNSYAMSLAAKKGRSMSESRSESYDATTYTDDDYTQY